MKYEEIWENIYNEQTTILNGIINDPSSRMQEGAKRILKFRDEAKERGIDIDAIADASVRKAEKFGDAEIRYDNDPSGDPYYDLSEKLNVIPDMFKGIALNEFIIAAEEASNKADEALL